MNLVKRPDVASMSIEEKIRESYRFTSSADRSQTPDKVHAVPGNHRTDKQSMKEITDIDESVENWFANTDEYQAIEELQVQADMGEVRATITLPSLPCDLESYRLTSLRAEGGTARVYRAYEAHSKQPIAIKLLRRRFYHDEMIKSVFIRHGKALSQISLPHFHRVLDSGDSKWGSWWAMEWVEGETLSKMIKQGVYLEGKRLLILMSQLCDALIGLHEQGIVHGDLNPNNVIYYKDPRNGHEQLTLIDLALPIKLYQDQYLFQRVN